MSTILKIHVKCEWGIWPNLLYMWMRHTDAKRNELILKVLNENWELEFIFKSEAANGGGWPPCWLTLWKIMMDNSTCAVCINSSKVPDCVWIAGGRQNYTFPLFTLSTHNSPHNSSLSFWIWVMETKVLIWCLCVEFVCVSTGNIRHIWHAISLW